MLLLLASGIDTVRTVLKVMLPSKEDPSTSFSNV